MANRSVVQDSTRTDSTHDGWPSVPRPVL